MTSTSHARRRRDLPDWAPRRQHRSDLPVGLWLTAVVVLLAVGAMILGQVVRAFVDIGDLVDNPAGAQESGQFVPSS